jgi:hypothetical protein
LLSTLLLLPLLLSCSAGRNEAGAKLLSFELAPKTERGHVLAESRFVLLSYGYTIEFGDANRNYEALRTHWRPFEQNLVRNNGGEETVELRDRAVLHLSPRGAQSSRNTQVASRLEFVVQTKSADRKKWIDITPEPGFKEQYQTLVYDIQNRLRRLGYQFN